MLDWSTIIPAVIATLAGAGWFKSWQTRRHEKETHNKQLLEKEAEILSKLRESETKYTREALEIYTQQVVEPLRDQLNRNTEAIARYQGAIDRAPECRIYPDCVVVRELQRNQDNYHTHDHGISPA